MSITKKILVVDDHGFVRHNLGRALNEAGHQTVLAADAETALDLLRHDQMINVVVTDFFMPQVNGIELFLKAQAIERVSDNDAANHGPTFLLMHAHNESTIPGQPGVGLDRHAMNVGFKAVLTKPVTVEMVLEALSGSKEATDRSGSSHFEPAGHYEPGQANEVDLAAHRNMIHEVALSLFESVGELRKNLNRQFDELEMIVRRQLTDAERQMTVR